MGSRTRSTWKNALLNLRRILGIVPREERGGIQLEGWPRWRVQPTRGVPRFLQALAGWVPPPAVLYLEGGSPPPGLRAFLEGNAADETCRVALGTIWPRPTQYHLAATRENLLALAGLAENCAAPEIAIHIHLYGGGRVLLEWYDAFHNVPFYVADAVPEESVRAFCVELGLSYARETGNQG